MTSTNIMSIQHLVLLIKDNFIKISATAKSVFRQLPVKLHLVE